MTDGTAATDAHYEYRSEDRSLALRWLTAPLFMPIVRRLPRGLTPNQVTLFGHACVWTSAAVALLVSDHETWVLVVLAFGYTGYNVADTIDGMYARYSGKTSRLGELLDHGLDPLGMALVPLTYGIALREPAWLVLASTAAVAYLQFLTFLHGYRVGYVVLGEVGVIEGLGIAAAVCVAAALGGLVVLTRPLFFDVRRQDCWRSRSWSPCSPRCCRCAACCVIPATSCLSRSSSPRSSRGRHSAPSACVAPDCWSSSSRRTR